MTSLYDFDEHSLRDAFDVRSQINFINFMMNNLDRDSPFYDRELELHRQKLDFLEQRLQQKEKIYQEHSQDSKRQLELLYKQLSQYNQIQMQQDTPNEQVSQLNEIISHLRKQQQEREQE